MIGEMVTTILKFIRERGSLERCEAGWVGIFMGKGYLVSDESDIKVGSEVLFRILNLIEASDFVPNISSRGLKLSALFEAKEIVGCIKRVRRYSGCGHPAESTYALCDGNHYNGIERK
jgi:hypothetical protein